ncbi:putative arginine transporter [Aspergillus clavatus NRRL 1]|uniref:Arginine transporter, putative n=1 Tax=Aspergillus clavatus (strain ATCC 1007 / CBS 513.65 / DSM 816 / NCTC 3887 / NRRL 1 / QM 1276 / 107) TaxID=344612 RepID=A1C4R0_ASPCL|nr:arginine transporter, putative [Aspergillus clavatus NRRL 1]EAW14678.1 arginine transporter, putative [Aspergillus clavatus NRRL 1]
MASDEPEVTAAPKAVEGKGRMINDESVHVYANNDPTASNDFDCEKHGASRESNPLPDLKRKLKSRHLQMIAIGGTIGTGLFISSGTAIAHAGPVGALIAYIFVGSIVYSVMTSLGEVATYMPIPGAFTAYATRLIDPSLGFAMGWIYWFSWAITFALELTATGLIIQFWNSDIHIAIFIGVFWVMITLFNFLPVSFYGELEFWFSSIKVLTVVGFMIFAICINAGAGDKGYIGFHYWVDPGPFAAYDGVHPDSTAKFVGFWAVLIQAGFSYQGTELVGIAAGETENPRKTVPSAIRKTFFRILFFFVLTIFFIGLLVPYTNNNLLTGGNDANSSPFVIAARLAGVKVLPDIINAVLLTVVLSAANSNVYSGSRILIGLAQEGFAPRWFKETTKKGVPYYSVAFTSAFGLLGFMNVSNAGSTVFNWFLNISSVAGFITWASLNACHIAFMRALEARNVSRDLLPYKALWQPFYAYYGLFFNILIIFTQGFTAWIPTFSVTSFFIAYLSLILFVVLYLGHKIIFRPAFVRPEDADLDTGRLALENEMWETVTPTKWYKKVGNAIFT